MRVRRKRWESGDHLYYEEIKNLFIAKIQNFMLIMFLSSNHTFIQVSLKSTEKAMRFFFRNVSRIFTIIFFSEVCKNSADELCMRELSTKLLVIEKSAFLFN